MSWLLHPRITAEGFAFFVALTLLGLALSAIVFIGEIAPVIDWLTEPPASAVLDSHHSGPR